MFFKYRVPIFGVPLGGDSPPSKVPVDDGSDLPYGYLLHEPRERKPTLESFEEERQLSD